MAASGFPLPPRYEVPELVAHGGMGDVFRADDASLERTVAIKVLAERYARDDEFRARFLREAQTAARLSGEPHVVTIFDIGEAEGLPYIVMEYLPGGSVADRLRAGRIPPAQALAWLGEAAAGLDTAHSRGIVHRDVKPGNLLFGADGQIRVSDFGVARAHGHETLTIAGTILGTSGYMSPEQARGERATAASDRYALACVAFELLTGRRPFSGETAAVEAAAHATAPIPAATDADPSLPAGIDAALERGLAKDPAARYESCGELVDELRRVFHDSAPETRPVDPVPVPVPVPVLGPSPTGPSQRVLVRRPSRTPAVLGVLGAAVVLGAAGFAVAWFGFPGDGERSTATIVRTQTVEGETQVRTVTVDSPTTGETPAPETRNGAQLNDEGFRLMQERDFEGALPFLEDAVSQLEGSGELVEAWASYNLALTRFALGECDGVIDLLDRSEQVQGERKEIDRLRRQAEKRCDEG